jgi:TetR/AcrR family transcriptional repressor of bet genes
MASANNTKQSYRRKSASERRSELIGAGIVCLGRGGMAGFTIDQICKQAGISRGLINHHFNTKDELLSAIYAYMTDHLIYEYHCENDLDLLESIIETSFDEQSFNRSNLRAWLAIWGQVASNEALRKLHKVRYDHYKKCIKTALERISNGMPNAMSNQFDVDSVARQMIAIIDGLWLEYCLHSDGFSLAAARADCYRFLSAYGVEIKPPACIPTEE